MKTLAIFSYSLLLVFVATSASAARLSVLFGGSSGSSVNSGYVRMFVTSTTYDGNLGGIAGADAKCQTRANAASLGGTWKAIISDSTTNAKSRTKLRFKPVFNLAGDLMWNPSIPLMISNDSETKTGYAPWGAAAYIANAPEITELGTVYSGTNFVWTGSTSSGIAHSANCTNWTSTTAPSGGIYGSTATNTTGWVITSSSACSNTFRLYCLEDE